jgi:hypothetical protein
MRLVFTLIFFIVVKISFAQTGNFYGLVEDNEKNHYLIRINFKEHKVDTVKSIGKFYGYYALSQTSDPKSYTLYAYLRDSLEKPQLVGIDVLSGTINCYKPYRNRLFNHYDYDLEKFICYGSEGVYQYDTANMNLEKIVDMPSSQAAYVGTDTYDPVSKTFVFTTSDGIDSPFYSCLIDIKNRKVLRKLKYDSLKYKYLQFDPTQKKAYYISDKNNDSWISTADSLMLNPKKLLKVSNRIGINDIKAFFDTAYQRYFYISLSDTNVYVVAYDVKLNKLIDSVRIPSQTAILQYFPDSTQTVITGLPFYKIEREVKLFPNPFSDHIYFESEFPIEKIEIYDLCGRRIESFKPVGNSIPTSNIKPGVYFALVSTGKNISRVKIVKHE